MVINKQFYLATISRNRTKCFKWPCYDWGYGGGYEAVIVVNMELVKVVDGMPDMKWTTVKDMVADTVEGTVEAIYAENCRNSVEHELLYVTGLVNLV